MSFDCLIFDCDGTLIDSEPIGHRAMAEELALLGIEEDAADMQRRYLAWRLRTLFDDLEARHGVRFDDGMEARWRTRVAQLYDAALRPIDGVAAMLAALAQPKCVASNGPRAKIEHGLRATGLLGHFGDRLYSAYDVGAWKPDPALFRHAAARMGAAPARCAVIEDSPVGVEAALAAGMPAFFYDPDGSHPSLPGVVAFADMADLPALLAASSQP